MRYLKIFAKKISNYADLKFFIKFILFYLILYYFTPVYVALADPKGQLYSQFIDHHYINYLSFLENSIINTANFFAHVAHLQSYVMQGYHSLYESTPIIKIDNGASIILSNGCLGIGIMSFWISFIISHNSKWQHKLIWSIAGVFVIFLINCFRISFLLFAMQNKWEGIFKFIDHHTMFNIVSYIIIFLMINMYYKSNTKYENKRLTAA